MDDRKEVRNGLFRVANEWSVVIKFSVKCVVDIVALIILSLKPHDILYWFTLVLLRLLLAVNIIRLVEQILLMALSRYSPKMFEFLYSNYSTIVGRAINFRHGEFEDGFIAVGGMKECYSLCDIIGSISLNFKVHNSVINIE